MKSTRFLIVLALVLVLASFSSALSKSAEPIVIGAVGPLSSITGRDCIRAVELAVEEINAKGGVNVGGLKRHFKIVSADTRDSGPGAPIIESIMAYEKVILQHEPAALVINAHRSEAMLASMDLIAKYSVPTLMSICISPAVSKKIAGYMAKGTRCFFHTSANVEDWAQSDMIFMDMLKDVGLTTVYGIYADIMAYRKLWQMTENGLETKGLEVVGADVVPLGISDFSASLIKAKKRKADVLWVLYETSQVGILAKQWQTFRMPGLLFMTAGPFVSQNAWKEYGKVIDGVVIRVIEPGAVRLKKYPKGTEFFEECSKRWPDWVCGYGHGPANSYDSLYILADAIERAGSLDKNLIIKAIEETDTRGVAGRLRFDQHHKIIYGADPNETAIMHCFQWQNGVPVPITPPSIAEGKIICPVIK